MNEAKGRGTADPAKALHIHGEFLKSSSEDSSRSIYSLQSSPYGIKPSLEIPEEKRMSHSGVCQDLPRICVEEYTQGQ